MPFWGNNLYGFSSQGPVVTCLARDNGQREIDSGRRSLLVTTGTALLLQADAFWASQASATTAPICEDLTTGEGGLQFCDAVVGSGNVPAKGSMIRCSDAFLMPVSENIRSICLVAASHQHSSLALPPDWHHVNFLPLQVPLHWAAG